VCDAMKNLVRGSVVASLGALFSFVSLSARGGHAFVEGEFSPTREFIGNFCALKIYILYGDKNHDKFFF